jgi:DNA-binding response OmpR family regulator
VERPRLLVVDDDPCTRTALHALFSRRGWEVELAASVAAGLARLVPSPRCVIFDLMLPDGGGEAILREVRANHPRTMVAVCSGIDDPHRLAQVRGLNPELLLWKPIELAPVVRLCEAALSASV